MRQKIPSLLLVLALLCSLTAAWAAPPNGSLSIELCDWNAKTYTPATAEAVRLTLNGETLSGDVPAMTRFHPNSRINWSPIFRPTPMRRPC